MQDYDPKWSIAEAIDYLTRLSKLVTILDLCLEQLVILRLVYFGCTTSLVWSDQIRNASVMMVCSKPSWLRTSSISTFLMRAIALNHPD